MPKEIVFGNASKAKQRAAQAISDYAEIANASADIELVRVPLAQIGDRAQGDTRSLNPAQVESLQESIAAVGLIAPLAIDQANRLLAGGHRRAALQQLQQQQPDRFQELFVAGIPCRRFAFDSSEAPEQALAIEISENEKRRNYTQSEIQAVAQKLQEQGYSRARGRGNTQPLIPALATAFGVNRKTIERALTPTQSNTTSVAFESSGNRKVGGVSLPADLADQLEAISATKGVKPAQLVQEIVQSWIKRRSRS